MVACPSSVKASASLVSESELEVTNFIPSLESATEFRELDVPPAPSKVSLDSLGNGSEGISLS